MRQIRYSIPFLSALCVTYLVLIVAGAIAYERMNGEAAIIGVVFLGIGIYSLPPMASYLFGGGLILEYDGDVVTYHGVLGKKTLRWEQVEQIQIKQVDHSIWEDKFLRMHGPFTFYGYASITGRLLARRHRPIEQLQDDMLAAAEGDFIPTAAQSSFESPVAPQQPKSAQPPISAMPDTRSQGVIGEVGGQSARRRVFGRR